MRPIVGTYSVDRLLLSHSTSVPTSAEPSLPAIQNPYPEIHQGCIWDGASRLVFVDWVIFTIGEGGTLSTTQPRRFSPIGAGTI